MSQLTGSKLTETEAAYLEKYGRDTSRSARHLDPDNSSLARIVSILCAVHPGNPTFNIPVLDIAAVCHACEMNFCESLEIIASVFAAMNKTITEKMKDTGAANPPIPWRQ